MLTFHSTIFIPVSLSFLSLVIFSVAQSSYHPFQHALFVFTTQIISFHPDFLTLPHSRPLRHPNRY
ncbi:hypothetical protein BDN72DRAFT_340276 [Pluteus cervinus]|uniref:Uncharacterized protein n=1 Tax=Pluteus cervinus TaxID=181527 RepID=A0ACD3ACH7_9AGAR|nr:hypothetical protein BDN72DRAFT_340276 [Pluteus cervinus]